MRRKRKCFKEKPKVPIFLQVLIKNCNIFDAIQKCYKLGTAVARGNTRKTSMTTKYFKIKCQIDGTSVTGRNELREKRNACVKNTDCPIYAECKRPSQQCRRKSCRYDSQCPAHFQCLFHSCLPIWLYKWTHSD